MDCHRFEKLLWESSELAEGRAELTSVMADHLKECHNCQQVYKDFKQLFDLSRKSQIEKDDIYWQKLEQAIWHKIETIENSRQPMPPAKDIGSKLIQKSPINTFKLIFSFGMATAVVLILLMAVTNITKQLVPPKMPVLAGTKEKALGNNLQTRTIDIVLQRASEKGVKLQEFSILPAPEVVEENDSALVSIEAVYLTDDGLKDKDIWVAKALDRDVVMKTGRTGFTMVKPMKMAVQPEERIITLKRMPHMKKIVVPDYPALAFRLRKEGDVWIKALVSPEGKILKAVIYKDSGTDYGFEGAALDAAYKNEFEPFEVDGKKLPVWVVYKVRFVVKG